jgi:hypothetical protein
MSNINRLLVYRARNNGVLTNIDIVRKPRQLMLAKRNHRLDARGSGFATKADNVFTALSTRMRVNTFQGLKVNDRTRESSHVMARHISEQRVRAAMEGTSMTLSPISEQR